MKSLLHFENDLYINPHELLHCWYERNV